MDGSDVLVINCGSSSIKFALIDTKNSTASGAQRVQGIGERLGSDEAQIVWRRDGHKETIAAPDADHRAAMERIVELLRDEFPTLETQLLGVGHRVVHGGEAFTQSVRIDDDVLRAIDAVSHLAPLHNPANLLGIRTAQSLFPALPQVAVFDTAFHATLPPHAYLYAVPYDYYTQYGVRRYGFHGTSHRYVTERAAELLDRPYVELALISAHLGNGCSAAAVLNGKSIDTTMGLTPLEGLVMGTRSGDVDPGLHAFLAGQLGIDVEEVTRILNRESGLLGLSGISNDMRTLEAEAEAGNERAALAIDIFCYRLAKQVAALAVPLGRIDALIFTGGIGENSAGVRAKTLAQLALLGFALNVDHNARNGDDGGPLAGRITQAESTLALVIPTDEEWMIARDTAALLPQPRN